MVLSQNWTTWNHIQAYSHKIWDTQKVNFLHSHDRTKRKTKCSVAYWAMHFPLEEYFFHCLAFMPNNLHSPDMDLGKEKVLFNLLLSLTFFVRGFFFFPTHIQTTWVKLGFRTSLGTVLTLPSLQWQNNLSLKEPPGDNKFLSSPLSCPPSV